MMGFEEPGAQARRDEQLFWEGLDALLAAECSTNELLDEALRNYFEFTGTYKEEYLHTEYDVARCSYKLLDSKLFAGNKDYVRRQIIYGLLQEDEGGQLHLMAAFLLYDGKQNENTFEEMNDEETFPRLLELLSTFEYQDSALHRLLLQLLYEMSRINRIRVQELSQSPEKLRKQCSLVVLVEEAFIVSLLQITETLSDDVKDPYHYPVIRVLLVLNEQFMVCAHDPTPSQVSPETLPNKVITVLADYGHAFKTFGENIILLLNRESETSLQLLILKLLYLLFTTPATYEYFYTNDLRVLVDVVIRNLLDLPRSASALRHTYLRVLHPLLAHTQLAEQENHYKRDELLKVLALLTGVSSDGTVKVPTMVHFGATDETTKRLGARCAGVEWLRAEEGLETGGTTVLPLHDHAKPEGKEDQNTSPDSPTADAAASNEAAVEEIQAVLDEANQSDSKSPRKGKKLQAPKRPPPRKGSIAAKAQAQQAQPDHSSEPAHPDSTSEMATASDATTAAISSIPTLTASAPDSSKVSIRTASGSRKPPPPRPRRSGASPSPSTSPSNRRAQSTPRPTPSPPPPRKGSSANRYLALGATNNHAAESSLSVAAVASPRAKPGVITPSLQRERGRLRDTRTDIEQGVSWAGTDPGGTTEGDASWSETGM